MGIFDNFFGDESRKDLQRGRQQADQIGLETLGRSRDEFSAGSEQAISTLAPDVEGGDLAREQLFAAIGLSGREAQQGFFNDFETDPGFDAELGAGIEAFERSASARSGVQGGGVIKGIAEFGQRFKRSAFSERLDRLTGLSKLGTDARRSTADLQFKTGSGLSDLESGFGQQRGNRAIDFNNAVANTRNTGLNNLFEIGKLAVGGGTAFAKIKAAG